MIPPIPHAVSRRAALRRIAAFSGAAATWCGGCANRAHETGRSPLEQFRPSKADSRLLEELERSATMFFREAAHPETGLVLDRKRADGGPDPRTVASIAATGSLPFLPAECLRTLHHQRAAHGDKIWKRYGFVDAWNPHTGWVNPDVIGIDVGIAALMAANLRDGFVWRTMQRDPAVQRGLRQAGI